MSETLYLSLASLFSMLGMAWLALSMDMHWAQVKQLPLNESRPPRVLLKTLGFSALFISLLLCLEADRPSIAVLVWIMLLAGAAFSVACLLARAPHVLKACWPYST
ncbi:MAG TPA: DUF3325 domain-containing protein [Limnobacter sp.]|nr:DUF3325 domain-containing protein [Limnobacter sp.]